MVREQFPPEGYVSTRSTVMGIDIFMPAPPIDDIQTRVDFSCPNCGGVQAFNVRNGGLSCTACGYYQAPKGKRMGQNADVNEFRTEASERQKAERIQKSLGKAPTVAPPSPYDALAGSAVAPASSPDASVDPIPTTAPSAPVSAPSEDYDWGENRQELSCTKCGASLLLAPEALTHTCPFCGSSSVNQQAFQRDKLRPRYLIPFTIETEKAKSAINTWLASSWMTPNDLQKRAGLDQLIGTYLPYWVFSATCSSAWRAEVGHDRTVSYTDSKGNRQTRTVTDWRWESGNVLLPIRDLLISGTAKLNARLLNEVDEFQIGGLVDHEPSYLAGFNAQTYDVGRDTAWSRGREVMRDRTKSACYAQASTSKVRNFSMTLDYSDETWRYVLVPVYLSSYTYNNETFSLLVNGQTSLISGQRPISWEKVITVCVLSFIPSLIAALVALSKSMGRNTQQVWMVAGVLLLVAIGITVFLTISASSIRKAN